MTKSDIAYKQIAKTLHGARIKKSMTQEALSAESGVPAAHIGFIEQGHRRPTVETLCKLTDALGIKLEQLFKGL